MSDDYRDWAFLRWRVAIPLEVRGGAASDLIAAAAARVA